VPQDLIEGKPSAEDAFERARREFFGTAKTTPAPSASPTRETGASQEKSPPLPSEWVRLRSPREDAGT
jgi:hypothetical protein